MTSLWLIYILKWGFAIIKKNKSLNLYPLTAYFKLLLKSFHSLLFWPFKVFQYLLFIFFIKYCVRYFFNVLSIIWSTPDISTVLSLSSSGDQYHIKRKQIIQQPTHKGTSVAKQTTLSIFPTPTSVWKSCIQAKHDSSQCHICSKWNYGRSVSVLLRWATILGSPYKGGVGSLSLEPEWRSSP